MAADAAALPAVAQTLQKLEIDESPELDSVVAAVRQLPNLRELSLCTLGKDQSASVAALIAGSPFPHLRILDVQTMGATPFASLTQACPKLQCVEVFGRVPAADEADLVGWFVRRAGVYVRTSWS